ncbi:glycoside hydrolase family 36 protein [uncultured Aquimarina sp.]|uniref:glycoside hydrolase family 36 protein n=1 Tax=uncultured Aquimarina sp. TaxID=575652 RepID=UPI002631A932|nr:glycoside hydrolase family 36 protein [uncultured Aquimarina sp.]
METYRYLLLSLIISILFSCKQETSLNYSLPETDKITAVKIINDSIKIEGDLGSFTVDKKIVAETDNIRLITFKFSSKIPSELSPITIKFNFPSIDINGYWNPKISMDKVNYYYSGLTSKASKNAPIISFYNNSLNNRITIALSDALNQSEIISYLKEEDVFFYPEIKLFQEKMPKTKFYEITLRIDTRSVPYYESISDVADWWSNLPDYSPMSIPNEAKRPMYSTWYSYHQNITVPEIIEECRIAKSLGCGAVIVDDGWQTKDGNRGYAYTGDWNPDRIPDMKGFVDAVHNEGMQFLLWYSLPFMGEKAKKHSQFEGKYLRHWESQGTYVLDPRYPEVRNFIVNTYIEALKNWNLDGFKLDFIGWFTATKDTKLTKEKGRDYASVNKATDALMTEITKKLTSLKPDILIEFRQPYIGPLMRKYGNMFRAVDAPNNAVANRVETTNLRIMAKNTAVHSDMFIWRSEESTEKAALQILNILYSVPQLSVRLKEIPEKHIEMIQFWFDYWNTNRNVLIDGKFIPSNPGANYPILTAVNNNHQITTLYEDIVVRHNESIEQLDIINAKASKKIVLALKKEYNVKLIINDCTGKTIIEQDTRLPEGIQELEVPESGIIKIKFKQQLPII